MKNLREIRKKCGLTQKELAERIGSSESAISMYETGKRIPRDEIKIRIAEYFHVPVESIFFPTKQHES